MNIKNIFFYIGMLIQLFYTTRIITINSYENSMVYILLIILCFSCTICLSGFKRKEFKLFCILILLSIVHMFVVNDTNLLRLVLMLYAGRKMKVQDLKKYFAVSYLVVFVLVVLLSLYTDFGDVYQTGVWRTNVGWETRYTLGFDGATRMMFVWTCCIISIQLLTNTVNVIRDIIFLIISVYLFTISVSYTGIITSVFVIIVPYIVSYWVKKKSSVLIKYFIRGSLLFVLSLTMLAAAIDISKTSFGLFLNGRTGALHYLLSNGIYPSFLGRGIPEGIRGLDNSYFYCSYILGIIPMCFMLAAIWQLGNVYYKNKDIMGCSCTVCFILIAYVTQTFEHPYLNYFIFLIMENWNSFITGISTNVLLEKNARKRILIKFGK